MKNDILSIISSLIAVVLVSCSYFSKKKNFLLFQSLCIIFLIISYFFNLQFFSAVGLFIGLIRTLTFYFFEKSGNIAPISISVTFALLTFLSYFVFNLQLLKGNSPVDLLYLTALVLYAFIFRITNQNTVRLLMIFPTSLSVLYNVLSNAPIFATASYLVELISNVISILKYQIIKVKQ